tara:strand:- start:144 stop:596 length:453 start_codon:yes stop_codon:yes gene_type:complete
MLQAGLKTAAKTMRSQVLRVFENPKTTKQIAHGNMCLHAVNSSVVLVPGYPVKGEIVAYSNALVNGQLTKARSSKDAFCGHWPILLNRQPGKNIAFSWICPHLIAKGETARNSSPFDGSLSESRHMMQQNCLSQANKPDMLHPRFLCFVV